MKFLLEPQKLQALRLQECQGTLIGGLRVATELGCNADDYGYRMMAAQAVDWGRLSDDLPRLVQVFAEHYQVTYDFSDELVVVLNKQQASLKMPGLAGAAAQQLAHWRVSSSDLEGLQRGFWRLIAERTGWQALLQFEPGFKIDISK